MAVIGLYLVFVVALIAAAVFTAQPALDLHIASLFYEPASNRFVAGGSDLARGFRQFNLNMPVVVVALMFVSSLSGRIRSFVPAPVPPRAALFVLLVFAVGPGLIVNGLLKPFWPRSRPGAVTELGGTEPFVAWWDPRGMCDGNCSFVSGEVSAAFALLAFAAIAPAVWRRTAIVAVVIYGTAVGFVRISAGGHFASDVVFAGVFTAALVWLLHGFLFRWPSTALSDADAERFFSFAASVIGQTCRKILAFAGGQLSCAAGGFRVTLSKPLSDADTQALPVSIRPLSAAFQPASPP